MRGLVAVRQAKQMHQSHQGSFALLLPTFIPNVMMVAKPNNECRE